MRFLTVFFILLTFIFINQTFAQIPNGDFESWTNGNPTGWLTDNAQGVGAPITQTTDTHGGSSAVRGEVLSIFGTAYPGYLWNIGQSGKGFAINQRYASLTGYYKLSPQGNDKFLVWVYFWSKDQVIAGNYGWFGAASSYTQFSVPLIYFTADTPDSASIWISASMDTSQTSLNANVGTVFFVDDLSLTGTATGVNDNIHVLSFKLEQNYPNPFNPTTTIKYSVPKSSFVTLKVYDLLGNEISTLVNGEKSAGYYHVQFNASNLASGVYFYRLTAGDKAEVKKLLLAK